jgi:P-type conjugative transfer protein TrbJ
MRKLMLVFVLSLFSVFGYISTANASCPQCSTIWEQITQYGTQVNQYAQELQTQVNTLQTYENDVQNDVAIPSSLENQVMGTFNQLQSEESQITGLGSNFSQSLTNLDSALGGVGSVANGVMSISQSLDSFNQDYNNQLQGVLQFDGIQQQNNANFGSLLAKQFTSADASSRLAAVQTGNNVAALEAQQLNTINQNLENANTLKAAAATKGKNDFTMPGAGSNLNIGVAGSSLSTDKGERDSQNALNSVLFGTSGN